MSTRTNLQYPWIADRPVCHCPSITARHLLNGCDWRGFNGSATVLIGTFRRSPQATAGRRRTLTSLRSIQERQQEAA